jgi:hypothetical protein
MIGAQRSARAQEAHKPAVKLNSTAERERFRCLDSSSTSGAAKRPLSTATQPWETHPGARSPYYNNSRVGGQLRSRINHFYLKQGLFDSKLQKARLHKLDRTVQEWRWWASVGVYWCLSQKPSVIAKASDHCQFLCSTQFGQLRTSSLLSFCSQFLGFLLRPQVGATRFSLSCIIFFVSTGFEIAEPALKAGIDRLVASTYAPLTTPLADIHNPFA